MQYVGKVGGYVYNQWNALNPATLSGAIDVIAIERADGSLHCSPWHVRFGKFQIIKPSQKKVDLYVNDLKTDLPMKLGEGGEAFFVFETDNSDLISQSIVTSPVISASSSAEGSPLNSPKSYSYGNSEFNGSEPEALDLNLTEFNAETEADIDRRTKLSDSTPSPTKAFSKSPTPAPSITSKRAFETVRKVTKKLNIPSKIDFNGDMVLDMDGYKPNSQKNIDNSDEFFKKKFLKEIMDLAGSQDLSDASLHEYSLWDQILKKDSDGNYRILNKIGDELDTNDESMNNVSSINTTLDENVNSSGDERSINSNDDENKKTFFKTLRLTSEQLKRMNLQYGPNKLAFKLSQGNAEIVSNLYLWKSNIPIVISDIDGTITKSDALGHVLNLIGKDWTHPGVAKLFTEISQNGYNIIYLTARSVGQADSTRQYLQGVTQDGVRLPRGPVILSPDRTMAALRREVILKKPEVFKMSCLNDIKSLYFSNSTNVYSVDDDDNDMTPFYAGFGNKITDAISYRSVRIPSHRIFTINPNGEVHMELLELAGYKSSYLRIGELVDHFFPPIRVGTMSSFWNDNQLNQYINSTGHTSPPGSPDVKSLRSFTDDILLVKADEKYNDVNYWRDSLPNLSELSDDDAVVSSPTSPKLLNRVLPGSHDEIADNPHSSFSSPLKSFMLESPSYSTTPSAEDSKAKKSVHGSRKSTKPSSRYEDSEFESDNEEILEDDLDYDADDLEGDEELDPDYDDDYTDDDDYDDDYDEEDLDEEDDFDEEEDYDDSPVTEKTNEQKSSAAVNSDSVSPLKSTENQRAQFVPVSSLMNELKLD